MEQVHRESLLFVCGCIFLKREELATEMVSSGICPMVLPGRYPHEPLDKYQHHIENPSFSETCSYGVLQLIFAYPLTGKFELLVLCHTQLLDPVGGTNRAIHPKQVSLK